jgi:hypothetical protein
MKIILFIFLFIQTLFAQPHLLTLLGDDAGYSAESQQYFDRLTDLPASDTLDAIATFIDGANSDGVWSKIDECWLFANKTKTNAYVGMKGLKDCSESGTITFSVYNHIVGNGSNGYLNTNFDPDVDGVNYTLNSGSFGVYSRNNVLEASIDIGGRTTTDGGDQTWGAIRFTGDNFYAESNSDFLVQISNNDSRGLFTISRTASDLTTLYSNGTSFITSVAASVDVFNGDIYICALNEGGSPANYSTRQYAFAFIGGGLTETDVGNLFNRLETLLDFLGAGVE